MAASTPGPWRIRGNRLGGIEIEDEPTGKMIAVVYVRETPSEEEPNAQLIASAPDLLTILRKLLESWGTGATIGPGSYLADDARAVLSRATASQRS